MRPAILVLGVCLAILGAVPATQMVKYHIGYERGRAEADRQLQEGRARIYTYGLVSSVWLDPQTGLVLQPIAGCLVDDTIVGRAAGYNERILKAIQQAGVPANSLRHWQREIADPGGSFTRLSQAHRPQTLRAGGPAVTSPDGRSALRLSVEADGAVPSSQGPGSLTTGRFEILSFTVGASPPTTFLPPWPKGVSAECVWGPPGSNLVFFRWAEAVGPRFEVMELQTGRCIDPNRLSADLTVRNDPVESVAPPPR